MSDPIYSWSGPHLKGEDYYLNPHDWFGDPDNAGYQVGATCWYYKVTRIETGGRRAFAAETPERAEEAMSNWILAESARTSREPT